MIKDLETEIGYHFHNISLLISQAYNYMQIL